MIILEILEFFLKVFVILLAVDIAGIGAIELIKFINKHRKKKE